MDWSKKGDGRGHQSFPVDHISLSLLSSLYSSTPSLFLIMKLQLSTLVALVTVASTASAAAIEARKCNVVPSASSPPARYPESFG